MPGMLYAVIEKCPVHGGRPVTVDAAAALAVPGVKRVVTIDGHRNPTWLKPGVAVVASSTWAALKGREALRVTWDEGAGHDQSSAVLSARFRELAATPGKVLGDQGDVARAFDAAQTKVDAVYEAPFLAHATLEPQNCVAHVHDGRCEILGPLQMPTSGAQVVAAILDIPRESVSVRMTRIGGGFGRRLTSDYAAEAAFVSRAVGAPVQVVWSREDDLRHDYYRPAGLHHVRAGLDATGRLSVWHHHLVNVSRNRYRLGDTPPESTEIYGLMAPPFADPKKQFDNDFQPTLIPHCRLEYTEASTSVPTGALRAPSHNFNAFVIESILDELAHAGGVDPVALRLSYLGSSTDFPYEGDNPAPYRPERLKRVLTLAAEKARWGAPLPKGRGRGIAAHFTFGSYAAEVAEVSVDAQKRLRVHRVVAAIDVGRPVNPLIVHGQTHGGIAQGVGQALLEGVARDSAGQVLNGSFMDYGIARADDLPALETALAEDPTKGNMLGVKGGGEGGVVPATAAVINALCDALGVDDVPMPATPERVWRIVRERKL